MCTYMPITCNPLFEPIHPKSEKSRFYFYETLINFSSMCGDWEINIYTYIFMHLYIFLSFEVYNACCLLL